MLKAVDGSNKKASGSIIIFLNMFVTYHVINHVFIQSRNLKYQLISKDLGWTVFFSSQYYSRDSCAYFSKL